MPFSLPIHFFIHGGTPGCVKFHAGVIHGVGAESTKGIHRRAGMSCPPVDALSDVVEYDLNNLTTG